MDLPQHFREDPFPVVTLHKLNYTQPPRIFGEAICNRNCVECHLTRQWHSLSTEHIFLDKVMDKRLLDILVCPVTKGKLVYKGEELWSRTAGLAYPVRDGIPVLYEAEARQLTVEEADSIKGSKENNPAPL